MPNTFPLYDSLVVNTTNKALLLKQKKTLIDNISSMDTSSKELLYALIKYHSIKVDDGNTLYNGEIETTGNLSSIKWDFAELPNQLQQVLLKFSEKEQCVKKETKIREELKLKMKNNKDIIK
jgi:hypothetical protein